jgi:hypothetical protein
MDLAELDAPLHEFNVSVYMDPGRRFLPGVLSMHTVEDTEGRERAFLVLETTEADPAPYVLSAVSAAGFLACVLALPRAGGRVGGVAFVRAGVRGAGAAARSVSARRGPRCAASPPRRGWRC